MFSGVFEPQDTVLLELVQLLTFSLDKSVVLTSQLSEYKKKDYFKILLLLNVILILIYLEIV